MALPQASVTLYIRSIVSGQDDPLDVSETKATVGGEQLSAASLTTPGSGTGISAAQSTVMVDGLLAVGSIVSFDHDLLRYGYGITTGIGYTIDSVNRLWTG